MTKERWQRIKEIFEAALELPPERRTAFVAEACVGDSSLVVEVESLLLGHDRANDFLARPAAAILATDANRGLRPRTFQLGELLSGRFQILRFIGEGGMGEVYAAKDLEIGSEVALKTIRAEIADDPAALARFKQELQFTRLVTHPNVCRTFDVAHHRIPPSESAPGKDVTYLTMELLQGETLAERLSRGPIPLRESLPWIRQMADALDAAHAVGVIHRDFKPGNVILCRPSTASGQQVKSRLVVTDFGLAHSFLPEGNIVTSLTRSGHVIGTMAYMAPEQLEGKEVTPAIDVYAFGLVIYQMVTGVLAFSSGTPMGAMVQRLKGPPPSPRTIVHDLPKHWESAMLKCLEVEPARRFGSAGEVFHALMAGEKDPIAGGSVLGSRAWLPRATPRAKLVLVGLLLALFIAAYSLRSYWLPQKPAASIPLRLIKFTADQGLTYAAGVSSDGRMVAYSSDRAGNGILNVWVQLVAGGPPSQVTHETSHVVECSCSPDCSQIVFRLDGNGNLYVISSFGGEKKLVALHGRHPTFSPDGSRIVYWSGSSTGDTPNPFFYTTAQVYVVPATGGPPQQIAKDFADARYAIWLPDGHHILFQGTRNASASVRDVSDWWVADLSQPQESPIQTHAFEVLRKNSMVPFQGPVRWWNDSIIFSARLTESNNLFQFHVSPQTWQVIGEPERLTFGTSLEIQPSISRPGDLFFTSWDISASIWAVPLGAKTRLPVKRSDLIPLTSGASVARRPSISLDGKKLAFATQFGRDRNLWFKDLSTGAESPLTTSPIDGPVISRDGTQVAYSLYEKPKRPVEVLPVGGIAAQRICDDCGEPLDWSYNGSSILYAAGHPAIIGLLDRNSGKKKVILKRDHSLDSASFGPNDQSIVFVEWLDADHSVLWLAPLRDGEVEPEAKWMALTHGQFADDKPRLSADGKSVYFYSNRDGFFCLWKLSLRRDPRRQGEEQPVPVLHLHDAGFTLRSLSRANFDLRLAKDWLIFNVMSNRGNLWTTTLQRK